MPLPIASGTRTPPPEARAPARRRASSSSPGPTTLPRPPSSRPSHQPPRPTDADDPPATALQLPPPDHELKVAALMGRGHRATSTKSRRARFPSAAGSSRATLAAYRAEFHDQGRVPSSSTAVAAAGEPPGRGNPLGSSPGRTAADRGRGQAQAFWSRPRATAPAVVGSRTYKASRVLPYPAHPRDIRRRPYSHEDPRASRRGQREALPLPRAGSRRPWSVHRLAVVAVLSVGFVRQRLDDADVELQRREHH